MFPVFEEPVYVSRCVYIYAFKEEFTVRHTNRKDHSTKTNRETDGNAEDRNKTIVAFREGKN